MGSSANKEANELLEKHKKTRIWLIAIVCLAVTVTFVTVALLRYIGRAMTGDLTCTVEVHTHSVEAGCYADECDADGNPILICEKEEHIHTEECYEAPGETESVGESEVQELSVQDEYNETVAAVQAGFEALPELEAYKSMSEEEQLATDEQIAFLYEEYYELTEVQQGMVKVAKAISIKDYKNTLTLLASADETTTSEAQNSNDSINGTTESDTTVASEAVEASTVTDIATNTSTATAADTNTDNANTTETAASAPVRSKARQAVSNNLAEYITKNTEVSDNNDIKYDDVNYDGNTKELKIDGIQIDFEVPADTVIGSGYIMYYTYPAGVEIQDSLLNNSYQLYVNNGAAIGGQYMFAEENGTYKVTINFDESFVNGVDGDINGYIVFSGYLGKDAFDNTGSVRAEFSDNVKLIIEGSTISYPENETVLYDIGTKKGGSYNAADDTLTYTVKIYSRNGTPNPITVKDVLTTNGLSVSGIESVTVAKGKYFYKNEWEATFENLETSSVITPEQYTLETNGSTATFSAQLDGLDENSYYELTYKYKLSNVRMGTTFKPSNKVSVVAEDTEKGQLVKDSAEISVNVMKEYKMSKNGYYNASDGKIYWTIIINENELNIADAKLTDTMFAKLKTDDVEIQPKTGWSFIKENDDTVAGIQFSALKDGANNNKYKITYATEVEPTFEAQSITNEAVFDGDGDGNGDVSVPKKVDIPGSSISKKLEAAEVSDDGRTAVVTWNINIDVPSTGIAEGIEINDQTFSDNEWDSSYKSGNEHYMTSKQALEWAGQMTWDNSSLSINAESGEIELTFKTADGNTYSYDDVKSGKAANAKITGWQIKVLKYITRPSGCRKLSITYKTTADLTDISEGMNCYYNKIYSGNVSSEDTYKYYKGYVLKKGNGSAEDTSVSNKDGSLVWTVELMTDNADTHKEFNVVDTLPSGVELKSLTLKAENSYWENFNINIDQNGNLSGAGNNLTAAGTYDKSSGRVETNITLKDASDYEAGTKLTLTYNCNASDKVLLEAGQSGNVYSFTNKVTVNSDNGEYGSDSNTIEWSLNDGKVKQKILDKDGNYDEGASELNYTVVINPEGKDLLEGADTLTLTDVLSYSTADGDAAYRKVTLARGSVKLYKAIVAADGTVSVGDEITDWSWKFEENELRSYTGWYYEQGYSDENVKIDGRGVEYSASDIQSVITAVIPDGEALIMKYTYSVYVELQPQQCEKYYDWLLNRTAKIGVINTVSLEGEIASDEDNKEQTQYKDASTSGGISGRRSYIFNKVETGNYNVGLQGAVFLAYREGSKSSVNTYTTDSAGTFSVRWSDGGYEENVLYYVTEDQAPSGYVLPENPEKYYFYFADSDKESEIYIPDGVKAVNLKNNEASVYVENEKADTTSINVVKKWLAADETEAYSPPYDEIEIVLYQTTTRIPSIIGNNPEESDACTAIGTYRLSENSIEKITELSGDYEIESTGSWSASIKGLPVVNNKGISYYYWVVEIEPDGYEASYSYDDEATFIQSGTITITNKPYMKYSLPETGSVGTMPIYLIGAAILIAAGLFDIKFKKSNIGNKVNKGSKKG